MTEIPPETEEIKPSPKVYSRTAIVRAIAARLQETEVGPIVIIEKILIMRGLDQTLEFIWQAEEIDQGAGMFLDDGRRRTVGGVFFHLVRKASTTKEVREIFYSNPQRSRSFRPAIEANQPGKAGETPAAESPNPNPTSKKKVKASANIAPPTEEELDALYTEMPSWVTGQATTSKLTIVGKPGQVGLVKPDNAALAFDAGKVPDLPKAVPVPAVTVTKYLMLIAAKQWRKIQAEVNNDANNRLLIEAYAMINLKVLPGLVGAATSAVLNVATVKDGKEPATPIAGIASTCKVTLVGRPGEVHKLRDMVAFTMTASKVPALPSGLPAIAGGTKYMVQVAAKHWETVESLLEASEEERIIIEGYPSFDPRLAPAILINVTKLTTKSIQAGPKQETTVTNA